MTTVVGLMLLVGGVREIGWVTVRDAVTSWVVTGTRTLVVRVLVTRVSTTTGSLMVVTICWFPIHTGTNDVTLLGDTQQQVITKPAKDQSCWVGCYSPMLVVTAWCSW